MLICRSFTAARKELSDARQELDFCKEGASMLLGRIFDAARNELHCCFV
jgi:hypothetical protein